MIRHAGTAALLALLVAGCGDAAGSRADAGVAVRDSAGVRIVENREAAPGGAPWTLEPAPLLDVGADDADPVYQVTDAVRLEDGRIVVASNGTHELRVYGPDGGLRSRIGREGEGPGEFRNVFAVDVLPGDTLAAWDPSLGRLSLFGPDGRFVRAVTPRAELGILPLAVGFLPGGRLVLATGEPAHALPPPGEASRDTLLYLVLGPNGEVADTIGRFPGTERVALGDPAGGLLIRPLPFGRSTVAAVHRDRVHVATGDRYQVDAYEPGRGLRARIRAARPAVPVGADDVRAYRDRLVTLGGEGDFEARRREQRLLDEAPYPETMPPITDVRTDAAGDIWVREPAAPDAQMAVWTVLSPDGRVRGSARLPADLAVKQIGRDWVLGVRLDEAHAEHVQLFRLTKR